MSEPIRVMVVDDSALIRTLLSEIINQQPDMEVVGVAPDPYVAREKIKELNPDVLTLDVEMPRMNGLDFLEKLMRLRPMPVVMVSSLTEAGATATLRALELGAVDFVAKPQGDVQNSLLELAEELTTKIRGAASARVRRYVPPAQPDRVSTPGALLLKEKAAGFVHDSVIAIGASTGGTEAIKDVIVDLPVSSPPVVITQHMPPGFTKSYSERLNRLSALAVKEAENGDRLMAGHAYVAPGHSHLLVVRRAGTLYAELSDGPLVNRHRPAVDVLFSSVAKVYGPRATAVILTGMGRDGAAGIAEIKAAGGYTIAQDEQSCIVFGMPKMAIETGAIDEIAPLSKIASILIARFRLTAASR
jgi:two-component system chemotaxis response regulator CheB